MRHAKAIVTLAIGAEYKTRWEQLCLANWKLYADRHGYDLHCFDEPLDTSERARQRSPAWQKCLTLGRDEVRGYERLVWIDSDILINPAAPCVVEGVPVEAVGAVEAWAAPTEELAQTALERMYDFWGDACEVKDYTAEDYYATYGLSPTFDRVVQTGVLVLSPQHHRELLERVYHEYEETGTGNYEMRPLSWELLRAGRVRWLDRRFNTIWLAHKATYYPFLLHNSTSSGGGALERLRRRLPKRKATGASARRQLDALCATTAFLNSYFLHFAGAANEMELADQSAQTFRDLPRPSSR